MNAKIVPFFHTTYIKGEINAYGMKNGSYNNKASLHNKGK